MARFETNILFWNIQDKQQNRQPTQQIVAMVGRYDVDVVMLAESGYTQQPMNLQAALNGPAVGGSRDFAELEESRGCKVHIFSRLRPSAWKQLCHRSRHDIWRLKRGAGDYLYLAAAHFPSVMEEQGDGQRKCAIDLRLDIDQIEQRLLKQAPGSGFEGLPLLVIGDLNASPFDEGIAGVYGLNATQRRAVARTGSRKLDDIHYPFMYNPMWQFFGAREERAPGTYYRRLSRPVCYDWYILDQVIFRPALLSQIKDSDVRVLEHTGVQSLVGDDQRPRSGISDHLPVLVTVHQEAPTHAR